MPEKKFGMFEILKGVFRIKKSPGEDIVYRAEQIVADYVAKKRGEILSKYRKKNHWLLNLFIVVGSGVILFMAYRLLN